jgi:hypothetical protein
LGFIKFSLAVNIMSKTDGKDSMPLKAVVQISMVNRNCDVFLSYENIKLKNSQNQCRSAIFGFVALLNRDRHFKVYSING